MTISRVVAPTLFFLIGACVGATLISVSAQRASYYWALGSLARIPAISEGNAKRLAASGDFGGARRQLIAALTSRSIIGGMTESELTWATSVPFATIVDLLIGPREMVFGVDVVSDPKVTFVLGCALADLDARLDLKEERVEGQLPQGADKTASKCLAIGRAYWGVSSGKTGLMSAAPPKEPGTTTTR